MSKYIRLLFVLILLAGFFPNVSFADFSFGVVGDSRGSTGGKNDILRKVLKNINEKTDGPIVPMGDIVNGCEGDVSCVNKFRAWRSMWGGLISRNYPVMGNHDRTNSKADGVWQRLFPLPENGPSGFKRLTYSFDYGDGHFVMLNSEKPTEHRVNKVQQDWLDKDLANSKKKYKFVFYHEPAFTTSTEKAHNLDTYPADRNALWRIIDRHNVTAVFSGHEHLFARKKINSSVFPKAKNTIYQFTVGYTDEHKTHTPKKGLSEYSYREKSYVVVNVGDDEKITVDLYAINGRLVNSFSFNK